MSTGFHGLLNKFVGQFNRFGDSFWHVSTFLATWIVVILKSSLLADELYFTHPDHTSENSVTIFGRNIVYMWLSNISVKISVLSEAERTSQTSWRTQQPILLLEKRWHVLFLFGINIPQTRRFRKCRRHSPGFVFFTVNRTNLGSVIMPLFGSVR